MRVYLANGIELEVPGESGAQAVLISPEGRVQLNHVAAAILGLCDGSRERAQIVHEVLRQTRNRARPAEIAAFLDAAVARGWMLER
jgi:hypothetical protein